jgi:hypothetical protein
MTFIRTPSKYPGSNKLELLIDDVATLHIRDQFYIKGAIDRKYMAGCIVARSMSNMLFAQFIFSVGD